MKTKGVSFNLADTNQRRLYEYAAKSTNFSAYVKNLISRDMNTIEAENRRQSGGIKIDLR